jgi:phosphotransferase system enzyme I (PtsI)
VIRTVNIDDCTRFARKVMEQSDPARIQELVLGTAPPERDRSRMNQPNA